MFRCEVTETRTVQLELKTERFGMAYRLLFAYAFVRAESEQNSSHPTVSRTLRSRGEVAEPIQIKTSKKVAFRAAKGLKMAV